HSFRWRCFAEAALSIIDGCAAYFARPADRHQPHRREVTRSVVSRMASDARLVRMLVATLALAFVVHQAYATFPLHLARSGYTPVIYGSLMSLNGLLIIVLELSVTTVTRRLPALIAIAVGLVLNGIGFGAIGLASIGGALLYSVKPLWLWYTCFALCLAAAGRMLGAWISERGVERTIASSSSGSFADEPAAPADR